MIEQINVAASIVNKADTVDVYAHGAVGGCETSAESKRGIASEQNRAHNQPNSRGITTSLASTIYRGNGTMLVVIFRNAQLSLEMVFDLFQGVTLNDSNGPMESVTPARKISDSWNDAIVASGGVFSVFYGRFSG